MTTSNRYVSQTAEQLAVVRPTKGEFISGIISSKSAGQAWLWIFDSADGVANMDAAHLIGGPYPVPAGSAISLTSELDRDHLAFANGCTLAMSTSFDSYSAAAAEFRFNTQTQTSTHVVTSS